MASASTRSLGKGRILGARSQPPQPSPLSQATTSRQVASSPPQGTLKAPNQALLSPSESSLSLNSQQSTSWSSNDEQDISAALARQTKEQENGGGGVGAHAKLVCPICNEEMMTLLQLNRHLDDAHKDIQEEQQDEIQDWFKSQVVKAKKFQPLALLNQKLKGLDVFDLNEERRAASISPAPTPRRNSSQHVPPPAPEPAQPKVVDPDDLVTRDHWQRYTRDGTCSDPMCDRRLGSMDGRINCRKCGKLFCEEHTMYQMKLSRSAHHEPVRGFWCRVCETCYKSRPGYNDHTGVESDHMSVFGSARRKAVDKSYLDVGRLEKRLTKLTQLLADPRLEQQDQGTVAYLRKASGQKSQRRQLEESVVDWEDDVNVINCPFCQQEFTSYTFRRHHCRVCGRIVCADPHTACSSQISLDVDPAHGQNTDPEKSSELIKVDVRLCKECSTTLFSKADFAQEFAKTPQDQRAFQNLKQFEHGIRLMLPRFQRLLQILQDSDHPPTQAQLSEATKVRKRLTDAFTQYDVAARRVRDMPTSSSTQIRLQKQVYVQASQFLHVHMLPLKSLPKILKHAAPLASASHSRNASSTSVATLNGHLSPGSSPAPKYRRRSLDAAQGKNAAAGDTIDNASQTSQSSRLSALEDEEKTAREQLIVLEEQRFMVGEMLADAQRRRKFEEVESLGKNAGDLDRECTRLRTVLEGLKGEVAAVWKRGEGNV